MNPKEDDKPAFTKDAVDYYGNVRKVDMNIHDVSWMMVPHSFG